MSPKVLTHGTNRSSSPNGAAYISTGREPCGTVTDVPEPLEGAAYAFDVITHNRIIPPDLKIRDDEFVPPNYK